MTWEKETKQDDTTHYNVLYRDFDCMPLGNLRLKKSGIEPWKRTSVNPGSLTENEQVSTPAHS